MSLVEIRIPQMGEGLREVLITNHLKRPGDMVRRDEPIYVMETDKATVEVESPIDGVLRSWLAQEGEVVSVGAPIASVQSEAMPAGAENEPAEFGGATPTRDLSEQTIPGRPGRPRRDLVVPPRTRSYCRKLGISEEEMLTIEAPTGKLMPSDVDRHRQREERSATGDSSIAGEDLVKKYREYPVPHNQRIAIYRMKRTAQLAISASLERPVSWDGIKRKLDVLRLRHPQAPARELTAIAYGVAQVVKEFPKLRSVMIGDDTVREYEHLNLGIAVSRPNDELVTALLPAADSLDFLEFARTAQARIIRALRGEDQASDTMQLLLTYMADKEITHGMPILVSPAVATLFVGAPCNDQGGFSCNLGLTFDHRLINGFGAALFLKTLAGQLVEVGNDQQHADT